MPVPCDQECGDESMASFAMLSESAQKFLIYCALSAAASAGNPELIGVYTVTEDENYIAPADASLIIWNVPTQAADRTITFTGELGQETQVLVIDSNGNFVEEANGGVFILTDSAPYVANVRRSSGVNDVVLSDGTAAQYNVGISGTAIGLLNTNWVKTGTTEFQGNVEIDGTTKLRFGSPSGPYIDASGGSLHFFYGADGAAPYLDQKLESVFGTMDLEFQMVPTLNAYAIFEALSGQGLYLTTFNFGTPRPIRIAPERTVVADFTNTGTLIATGGAGGTRIAKLLTGLATMAGGTIAVVDTDVTAGSTIQLTPGFAPAGVLSYAKNPGVGFTINSTNPADAGEISYTRCVI